MPAGELLPILTLTLCAFLLNTSEFVPIGLLTDIAGAFGLSESGAGLMVSIYAWAVALLSLPLMIAASRISPKALVVGVLAIFALGQVGAAISPTFELLVASRVVVAASHAVFWSIASPFAVRVARPEHASLAMSMIITGTSVAMILGLPLGRALGLALGWRMTFVCVAVAALVALLGLIAFFPALERSEPFTLSRLPELAHSRALLGMYLVTMLFATGYYTGYSYIEPFLAQVASFSPNLITAALTVFGIAGLFGSWLFARLFERHRRSFLSAATAGVAAALLMLAPLSGWLAGPFAVCAIWGASATAFNVAAQAQIIRITSEGASAVAMAIFSGLFNVGIGAGSAVGGIVCDGLGISFVGAAGGAIAVAGVAYGVARLAPLLEGAGRSSKEPR